MQNNFDPQELAKFSAFAVHWWDVNGALKTLHQVNPLRLRFITERVDLREKKVIDIGCGGGILSEAMAKAGANVTGVDMNDSVVEVAKLHLLESGLNVEYLCTQAESIAAERHAQYDVVTCLELLEHVPDPVSVIQACGDLLKPGGHIFFSTLNRNPKSYLFAIVGAEHVLGLLPKGTHDYAKFIRPAELEKWCRAAHLKSQEIRGITYNPFTKLFSLSNDIAVNYLYYARKS